MMELKRPCKTTWVVLYFTLINIFAHFAHGAKAPFCQHVLSGQINQTIKLHPEQIYSEGRAQFDEILFLTRDEYIQKKRTNQISSTCLLVLDDLPEDDIPIVAGIIIKNGLQTLQSHNPSLAKKLGMPLIAAKEFFTDEKIINLNLQQEKKILEIVCRNGSCNIHVLNSTKIEPRISIPSVLPPTLDRTHQRIYSNLYPIELTSIDLAGEKYFNLLRFRKEFPSLVPKLFSLSTGYFESFLNEYNYQGKTLREWRKNVKNSDQAAHFQEAILNAYGIEKKDGQTQFNLFEKILKDLRQESDFKSNQAISIRTNNPEENLIGNGVYESQVIPALNIQHLESALRSLWASLYSRNAFEVRQRFSQNEENVSMPVLMHSFIENVKLHAVASFQRNSHNELELRIEYVVGDTEKATSPSPKAQVGVLVINDRKDVYQNQNQILSKNELSAIQKFYEEVKPFILKEFEERIYPPHEVNLEFIVRPMGRSLWPRDEVIVLQYQPHLTLEQSMEILSGQLKWEQIFANQVSAINAVKTQERLQELSLYTLSNINPQLIYNSGLEPGFLNNHTLRFSLMLENGSPFLIAWPFARQHAGVKNSLKNSSASWYKSGYIKFGVEGTDAHLLFALGPYTVTLDRRLADDVYQNLMIKALQHALNENPALEKLLEKYKPLIEIVNDDDSIIIEWSEVNELFTGPSTSGH